MVTSCRCIAMKSIDNYLYDADTTINHYVDIIISKYYYIIQQEIQENKLS